MTKNDTKWNDTDQISNISNHERYDTKQQNLTQNELIGTKKVNLVQCVTSLFFKIKSQLNTLMYASKSEKLEAHVEGTLVVKL